MRASHTVRPSRNRTTDRKPLTEPTDTRNDVKNKMERQNQRCLVKPPPSVCGR